MGLARICEAIVFTVVILILIAIFLIPTLLYAFSEDQGNGSSEIQVNQTSSVSDYLVCSEGFFFDNKTALCKPDCQEFRIIPLPTGILVVIYASVCVSLFASIVMFIQALTVQRDKLFAFPLSIYVYLCVTTFILFGMILIGSFDNAGLFCGSRDLKVAGENQTAFCTITGLIFTYCLNQLSLWGLLHTIFLFWAVVYPFNYKLLKDLGRIRYAHIISVLLAVTIPLPLALAPLKDGYRIITLPTFACISRNTDLGYYTIILPISVMIASITCLLVVILWTIFKKLVLNRMAARKSNIGKAELKLTILVIYYIIIGVMGLSVYTHLYVNQTEEDILEFFTCESNGEEADCMLESPIFDGIALFIAIELMAFIPVVAILLNCSPKTYKEKIKSWRQRRKNTSLQKNLNFVNLYFRYKDN